MVAINSDARLSDPRVIASIHRAVYKEHREKLLATRTMGCSGSSTNVTIYRLGRWWGDPKEKFKLVRDLIAKNASPAELFS